MALCFAWTTHPAQTENGFPIYGRQLSIFHAVEQKYCIIFKRTCITPAQLVWTSKIFKTFCIRLAKLIFPILTFLSDLPILADGKDENLILNSY